MPVWVPLSTAADWRWMRDREDSPWYPSMRLFRQEPRRDWGPSSSGWPRRWPSMVAATAPARPIVVEVAAGELIDKITILEIKAERIADPAKLGHVRAELASLEAAPRPRAPPTAGLDA